MRHLRRPGFSSGGPGAGVIHMNGQSPNQDCGTASQRHLLKPVRRSPPSSRWLRVAAWLLLSGTAVLSASGVYLRIQYPGLFRGSMNQYRFSTMHENRNLWFLIGYWLEFMQKMRQDPATGGYNFNRTPTDGLSDYEKGRIEYHPGAFADGVSLIASDIRTRGENEAKLFWLGLSYMRRAEAENCLPPLRGELAPPLMPVHEHMPDHERMCSLPIDAFHKRAEFAQAAAAAFEG